MDQFIIKDGDGKELLCFADEAKANESLDVFRVDEDVKLQAATKTTETLG